MVDERNIEQITKLVMEMLRGDDEKEEGFLVPVGVSARHVHLTQADVETLFGPGYQLTKKKDLMGGQFASNEQVTIVGTKLRAIENVRILGPFRRYQGLCTHRSGGTQGSHLFEGRLYRSQKAYPYVSGGCACSRP